MKNAQIYAVIFFTQIADCLLLSCLIRAMLKRDFSMCDSCSYACVCWIKIQNVCLCLITFFMNQKKWNSPEKLCGKRKAICTKHIHVTLILEYCIYNTVYLVQSIIFLQFLFDFMFVMFLSLCLCVSMCLCRHNISNFLSDLCFLILILHQRFCHLL